MSDNLKEFNSSLTNEKNHHGARCGLPYDLSDDISVMRHDQSDDLFGGAIPPSQKKCEIFAYCSAGQGHYMPVFHSHNYCEFIFVFTKGSYSFSNTSGTLETDGQCVCFHNSHVLHKNNAPPDACYDRVVLYFGESALSMLGDGMGSLGQFAKEGTVLIQLDRRMLKITKRLLRQLLRPKITDNKKRLLTAIILNELKEYSNEDNTKLLRPALSYIKAVMEHIDQHYMESITTPELSRLFFVSVNKLNRDFRRFTGSSIKQYLIDIRMKHAQLLLASGESVKNTAELCGFESLSYFISTFRQHTGITPSSFAKCALGHAEQ